MSKDARMGIFARLAGRLKYPHLLLVVMALFGLDLVIPDALPFIDEIILGSMTVLLGAWRKRRGDLLDAVEKPAPLPPSAKNDDQ